MNLFLDNCNMRRLILNINISTQNNNKIEVSPVHQTSSSASLILPYNPSKLISNSKTIPSLLRRDLPLSHNLRHLCFQNVSWLKSSEILNQLSLKICEVIFGQFFDPPVALFKELIHLHFSFFDIFRLRFKALVLVFDFVQPRIYDFVFFSEVAAARF